MLNLINEYLQIGIAPTGGDNSMWTIAIAAVCMAAAILRRQSDD
jgi:hypothetical protein